MEKWQALISGWKTAALGWWQRYRSWMKWLIATITICILAVAILLLSPFRDTAKAWSRAAQNFVAVRATGTAVVPSLEGGEENRQADSPAQITEKVASLEKEVQDIKEEAIQSRQAALEVKDSVGRILKESAQQKADEDAKQAGYLSGLARLDEAVRKLEEVWQRSGVSRSGDSPSANGSAGGNQVPSGRINLNTATATELDSLPGIGPAYAQRIVAYRQQHGPFKDVRDLLNVEGIGNSTLEKFKDLVTL